MQNKYVALLDALRALETNELNFFLAENKAVYFRLSRAVEHEATRQLEVQRRMEQARERQEQRKRQAALDHAKMETDQAYQTLLINKHLLSDTDLEWLRDELMREDNGR